MHFAQLCYHTICPQNTPSISTSGGSGGGGGGGCDRPTDNETLVTFNWHTTGVLYNMHMQALARVWTGLGGIECN